MHQRSTRIATAVQIPKPPPAKSTPSLYTLSVRTYPTKSWKPTAIHPHAFEPISRNVTAIATMHGGMKRLNIMNESAASFGKSLIDPKRFVMCAAVEAPSMFAATSPRVAVACSFAISAETEAAAPCHVPNPSGARIHAIHPPTVARMDCSICSSSSRLKPKSKCMTNQRNTHAGKMMSPALSM